MRSQLIILITTLLLCSACNNITERKQGFSVHGVDVSRYQSEIDWKEVASQDITFAFVKASEGETITDTHFCQNWAAIKEANIKRGAYHFFRPTTSVLTQAQNFIDNVILENGDLPPVLDVEVMDGVSKEDLVKRMQAWLDIIEMHFQIKPVIYTNQKFFNEHLAKDFKDYPLWIARYNNFFEPKPSNNKDWLFWQYGNKGRVNGIDGDVDLNVFQGSLEELEALTFKQPHSLSLQ